MYFTWKDNGITNDCSSLEAMASRFEESAKLMRRMASEGFVLENNQNQHIIKHSDKKIFESWGFISEESKFKQLTLIVEN